MKLIRCGSKRDEYPGVLTADGQRLDVRDFVSDYNRSFFTEGGIEELQNEVDPDDSDLPRIPDDERLGPPVANPSKIVCVGLNYTGHADETGADLPDEPVLFFKATTALAGPFDDLVLPKGSTKTDWEVELAAVIGSTARYVDEEDAMDHVAGYMVHNDYSEREHQKEHGGQWVKGKSADTFAPVGPFLATADEVEDPHNLDLWLDVNGERRQQSNTSKFLFDIPEVVSYISRFMTLLPGDIISTGTPPGVGLGMNPPQYLEAGDVVELGIDQLGSAKQNVVSYEEARS